MHSFILPFNIYSVLNLARFWAHKIRHYVEYRHNVLTKYCHRTEHPSWVGVVKEPKKLSQRSIIQKLWIAMLSPFYVAFCCENNFLGRILLPISAGSFPAVGKETRRDIMLASPRTSESTWSIFPLLLWIHSPLTFVLLCSPEGWPVWTSSNPLLHTDLQVQSENIAGEEALARDLQEEGELDHGTYA